jgi:hypothetical protein
MDDVATAPSQLAITASGSSPPTGPRSPRQPALRWFAGRHEVAAGIEQEGAHPEAAHGVRGPAKRQPLADAAEVDGNRESGLSGRQPLDDPPDGRSSRRERGSRIGRLVRATDRCAVVAKALEIQEDARIEPPLRQPSGAITRHQGLAQTTRDGPRRGRGGQVVERVTSLVWRNLDMAASDASNSSRTAAQAAAATPTGPGSPPDTVIRSGDAMARPSKLSGSVDRDRAVPDARPAAREPDAR